MIKPERINKAALLASLPDEWPENLLPTIHEHVEASGRKVVVLDDDPTGTQTVHDIPVLTEWSVESLKAELTADAPAFYLLTNSRSVPLAAAQAINADIGRNLVKASQQVGVEFAAVSRSDLTLRGHFPGEVEALVEATGQVIDGWLILPFFLEGGRYTVNDVHYVAEGEWLLPAAETPFAQDAAFGYRQSNLRRWVEEKTGGRVPADSVSSISIDDIRTGGPVQVANKLHALSKGTICIINAASTRDMEVFVQGLLLAEAQGKKFVYRTAASFVQVRAGLAPRPVLTKADLDLPDSGGGLFVVGSYVPKTTSQVDQLLTQDIVRIEVDVPALLAADRGEGEIARVVEQTNQAMERGDDTVIYTSRTLVTGDDADSSLSIGQRVSEGLVTIVRSISIRPRYLVAKGGITSSDIATKGLEVKRALVLGQILPGVPLWQLGPESRQPDMPYIVFPGNVGGDDALVEVMTNLKN